MSAKEPNGELPLDRLGFPEAGPSNEAPVSKACSSSYHISTLKNNQRLYDWNISTLYVCSSSKNEFPISHCAAILNDFRASMRRPSRKLRGQSADSYGCYAPFPI